MFIGFIAPICSCRKDLVSSDNLLVPSIRTLTFCGPIPVEHWVCTQGRERFVVERPILSRPLIFHGIFHHVQVQSYCGGKGRLVQREAHGDVHLIIGRRKEIKYGIEQAFVRENYCDVVGRNAALVPLCQGLGHSFGLTGKFCRPNGLYGLWQVSPIALCRVHLWDVVPEHLFAFLMQSQEMAGLVHGRVDVVRIRIPKEGSGTAISKGF